MSFESELKEHAERLVAELQTQNVHLRKEIRDAELHVAELKLKADAQSVAPERALKFTALLGGEYLCPECWVRHNAKSILAGRNSPDERDFFACKVCGHEFVTPA